ncbi:hypothetical protein HY844_00185 [Candidatus Berkelbacteria bacterium]|nr:hypothetical protein [Candidatus Berkelbacteria bacterium]
MKKAFTLVELLLYLGVSAVVLLSSSLFLGTILESRIKNQAISEVDLQGKQVTDLITQSLRESVSINSPTSGNSANSLSFNTPTASLNPTIVSLSGGAIHLKEGSGAEISLTNSRVVVTELSFTSMSNSPAHGSVRIRFVLSYKNPSARSEFAYSKTFITTASLRR